MSNYQKRDESKKLPSLMIGMTCVERLDVETCFNLFSLGRHYAGPLGFHYAKNSVLPNGCDSLVVAARHLKLEWLLIIDSDMTFPADLPQRLLSHEKDIVVCAYRRRGPPFEVMVLPENSPREGLQKIERGPTGVMLVRMSVFDKLKLPYFRFVPDEALGMSRGADFEFCASVQEVGYDVWCDWETSKQIGHFFKYPLTLADTGMEASARQMLEALDERAPV